MFVSFNVKHSKSSYVMYHVNTYFYLLVKLRLSLVGINGDMNNFSGRDVDVCNLAG